MSFYHWFVTILVVALSLCLCGFLFNLMSSKTRVSKSFYSPLLQCLNSKGGMGERLGS